MEKHAKKVTVSQLKDGDKVDDLFFVKFKKGFSQYAKGYTFELTLSDASGRSIEYRYWGGQDERKIKALYDSIKSDSIVHVQGKVALYKDKLQLATNEPLVFEVLAKGSYEEGDFLPPAKRDLDEMYKELKGYIALVGDHRLKGMLAGIFSDPEMEYAFKRHPAAIDVHHNWIGGLLQHTLEVLGFCRKGCETYPELDRDLVIAGAILHDIGKLEELEMTSRIKGTRKGQLIGHLVLSVVQVSRRCDEFGVPEELKDKLLHMIVSHHGKLEFGSPKSPMFPEAVLVYYSDELSSKLAEMTEFIKGAKSDTDDDFMYSKRNERNILLR